MEAAIGTFCVSSEGAHGDTGRAPHPPSLLPQPPYTYTHCCQVAEYAATFLKCSGKNIWSSGEHLGKDRSHFFAKVAERKYIKNINNTCTFQTISIKKLTKASFLCCVHQISCSPKGFLTVFKPQSLGSGICSSKSRIFCQNCGKI